MARLRLGVALLLPSPVAEEVDGLRRALGDSSLNRVPPHLTLVPPVNVRQEDLGQALAVLRSAAAATPLELTITLDAPASFLPANPVLYLPVAEPGVVHTLRNRIWKPPLTRSLAWPFVPHVTLADQASETRVEAAQAALADYTVTVSFERVHLLVERRPGPYWLSLADVAFGPPAIVARGSPLAVEMVRSQRIDPEATTLLEAEGETTALTALSETAPRLCPPIVVTARREGQVVGVAMAWCTPAGAQSAVFVARHQRGQGIGRHLHAALAAAVADAGWGALP